MSRILIDGRFIGVGDSMTRYTLEILKGILMLDKQNEYTLLVRPQGVKIAERFLQETRNKIQGYKQNPNSKQPNKLTPNSYNLNIEVLDIPHYSFAEQTKLLSWLNEKKFDLVHFTQFNHPIRYRGKFVVTIHDLTLIGHLHRMNFGKKLGFRIAMRSAIKKSAKILTVSQTSKDDIVDYYKINPNKVEVIYLAVDPKYSNRIMNDKLRIKAFKKKYGISGDYILYTGMWKRHKNLLRMLKAFEQVQCQMSNVPPASRLRRAGKCQVVLVGKIDKDEPEVLSEINRINSAISNFQFPISNEMSNKLTPNSYLPIVATGFIDEEVLPLAYAGALVYCIPSLSEGFGLPPLEAMACGTPVISSNISAMPEILGDAPLYFDPYNVDDIAKAMKRIIEDKNLRDQLVNKGLEQVKKYSWKDTARKTLEVYKNTLS